ncbi:MAG: hypothetical protein K9G62_07375 [Alphaproteobacteria bacterium]|nr:hypothetical protein [Alphaproteobacteria bacterium]
MNQNALNKIFKGEAHCFCLPDEQATTDFAGAFSSVFSREARPNHIPNPLLRLGLVGTFNTGKSIIGSACRKTTEPVQSLETAENNQTAFISDDLGTVRHYDLGFKKWGNSKGILKAANDKNFREKYPQGLDIVEHADMEPDANYDYAIHLDKGKDHVNCILTCQPEIGSKNPAFQDFLKKVEHLKIY